MNQASNLYQSLFWKEICKKTNRLIFEKKLNGVKQPFYAWLEPPQTLIHKNIHKYIYLVVGLYFPRIMWRDYPCRKDVEDNPEILKKISGHIFGPFSVHSGHTLLDVPGENQQKKYLRYTLNINDINLIFSKLDKNTQNKIKQGKKNLTARWLRQDEIIKYHALLKNQRFCSKLNLPPFFLEKRIIDLIEKNTPSQFIKVLGVFNLSDQLEAAMTLIGYQQIGYEFGLARKIPSNFHSFSGDFLKFSAFEKLASENINVYDFGGLNSDQNHEKKQNINYFKLKWKGDIKHYLLIQ